MPIGNDYVEGRTASANPPLLSSESWKLLRSSFEKGAIATAAFAAYSPSLADEFTESGLPDIGGVIRAAGALSTLLSMLYAQAAELAKVEGEQAELAEAIENEQRNKVMRQLAAEQKRQREFEVQLSKGEHNYRESVRSGEFLRDYRDPPSDTQMDRARGLA